MTINASAPVVPAAMSPEERDRFDRDGHLVIKGPPNAAQVVRYKEAPDNVYAGGQSARRIRAILESALAISLVLGAGACTSSSGGQTPTSKAVTTPASPGQSGTAYNEPAAVWTRCPDMPEKVTGKPNSGYTFDCATIQVPQDWHHPDTGKTFDIALVRVRGKNQHNRIGSILVDPGGPGGSGIRKAVRLVTPGQNVPAAISDRFDLVGFDARGVGASTELQCLTPETLDAMFGADPDPRTQAGYDAVVAINKAAEAPCAAKYGAQLPLFSTEQSARDMDAIRQAVGDQKLTYLGYSYGTLLGAVYAQLFPQHVRALVLDGTLDPQMNWVQRSESQAAGLEHAFNNFTKWCKANPRLCPIADDPAGEVAAALSRARTSPVTGPDSRKATAGWIFTGVIGSLYSKDSWAAMAEGIAQLKTGNANNILYLADAYAARSPNGQYTNLFDVATLVTCTDYAQEPTVAQIRAYQSQWREKYPLFGAPLAIGMLPCAARVWPGTHDPYPTGPATGAPPIVLVGTTGDPATPYAQTAKLASMLGNSHIITWDGEGHTAYPQTTCVNHAVDAYLINLTVPKPGLTCPAAS